MAFGVEKPRDLLLNDIFFIQRTENERGSPCIFKLANHTDIIGQVPRTHDKRVGQLESEVVRGEVHLPSLTVEGGGHVSGRLGSATGTLMPANCW